MANAGHKLNEALLKDIENTFALSTIFEWYRTLVGDKYNRTERGKKKGRKPVSDELRDLILKIAKENTSWGYRRIASYIHYLGYDITFITVKRVLDNVGIVPPEDGRKTNHFWQKFSDARKNVIAACDFATYKIVIPKGLIRESILFFEDITTREVWLGGISAQADGPWTAQIARNQVDSETGPLRNMKYLIHDCDVLYTKDFVSILESTGPTSKRTPPRPPQLNGHVESFIKTFKTECLDHLVLTSEAQLRLWYGSSCFITTTNDRIRDSAEG